MGWWKRFIDWLDTDPQEHPLKDWDPLASNVPPARVEWLAAAPSGSDAVVTVGLNKSTDGESDPVSEEKSEVGDVTTETTLEHAEYLPGSTFRVFPRAANHRNVYDSQGSVRRAVAARKNEGQFRDGVWVPDVVKVYKAETVWHDVTSEYVN